MQEIHREMLQKSVMFQGLDPDAFEKFAQCASTRTFDAGQSLFHHGDHADRFYVVLSGCVKLFRLSPAGEEVIIEMFGAGDPIAEAAMFGNKLFPASAEAISSGLAAVFRGASIFKMIANEPDIAISMLESMSRRMHFLVREIEELKGHSTAHRLANFIAGCCPQGENRAEFDLPFKKSLLASKLGMTPESLSRAFIKLASQGVETSARHVIVPDVRRLHMYLRTSD